MPAWHKKLFVGSPPNTDSTRPSLPDPHLDPSYARHDVPTLKIERPTQISSGRRPNQNRSFSHPSASISKSSENGGIPLYKEHGIEPGVGSAISQRTEVSSDPVDPVFCGLGESPDQPGFAIGRCATCGTKLRWPRHVFSFRCTICLMINDLRPVSELVPSMNASLTNDAMRSRRNIDKMDLRMRGRCGRPNLMMAM